MFPESVFRLILDIPAGIFILLVVTVTSSAELQNSLRTVSRFLVGKEFIVSAYHLPPYVIYPENTSRVSGSHYAMLEFIASKFNFSVHWNIGDEKNPRPAGVKDGMPTGVMADVVSNLSHFTPLTSHSFQRHQFLDFTSSIQEDSLTFVTAVPRSVISWTSIVSSYSQASWWLILLSFIPFSIIYFIVLMQRQNMTRMDSVWISIYVPLSIAIDQSTTFPRKFRLITSFWLMLMLLVGQGYKCNLVSFLSTPDSAQVPRTFAELHDRQDYKVVLNYLGGTAFRFFNESNNEIFKRIQVRFQNFLEPTRINCILQALAEEKTVCIGWEFPIKTSIMSNLSLGSGTAPLSMAMESARSLMVAFGFPKKSRLTDPFNKITGLLKGMGLIKKWNQDAFDEYLQQGTRWLRNGGDPVLNKILSDVRANQELNGEYFTLRNLVLVFIGYAVSCAFSIIIFSAEIFYATESRSRFSTSSSSGIW